MEIKLTALVRAIDQLRVLDPDMPSQQVVTFLTVAAAGNEGIPMADLRASMGMTGASTSRNVAALGKVHRRGLPGLELVEAYENPMNRSQKIVVLTPKGRRVAQAMAALVG